MRVKGTTRTTSGECGQISFFILHFSNIRSLMLPQVRCISLRCWLEKIHRRRRVGSPEHSRKTTGVLMRFRRHGHVAVDFVSLGVEGRSRAYSSISTMCSRFPFRWQDGGETR